MARTPSDEPERRVLLNPFEPIGPGFDRVLEEAASRAVTMSMVVRWPDSNLSAAGRELLRRLAPFEIDRALVDRWPGTVTDATSTTQIRYRSLDEVVPIVRATASCLYSFCAPEWPEDLCFYRADGSVVIGSTAHEYFWWVEGADAHERAVWSVPSIARSLSIEKLASRGWRISGDGESLLSLAQVLIATEAGPEYRRAEPVAASGEAEAIVAVIDAARSPAMPTLEQRNLVLRGSIVDLAAIGSELAAGVASACVRIRSPRDERARERWIISDLFVGVELEIAIHA